MSSLVSILLERLYERYGRPTLTFEEAAEALSFRHTQTAYTARKRGKFPIRVIDLGGRLGCTIVDLAEFLATGVPQADCSVPQRRKPGRPTNAERARRAAEGGA